MNIFYLSHDTRESARFQVDSHAVKMILETAQILSTTHRYLDGTKESIKVNGRSKTVYTHPDKVFNDNLYSCTHINHPSTMWARQSGSNYLWLYHYFLAMLEEYTHRYGKNHKCEFLIPFFSCTPKNIPVGIFTEPTPAMPTKYIVSNDSIASYRSYYMGEKRHLFKWTKRQPPSWLNL